MHHRREDRHLDGGDDDGGEAGVVRLEGREDRSPEEEGATLGVTPSTTSSGKQGRGIVINVVRGKKSTTKADTPIIITNILTKQKRKAMVVILSDPLPLKQCQSDH